MKTLTIILLLSGLFFTNTSFALEPGEVSYNQYGLSIINFFKNNGETPSVFIGDSCRVTLKVNRELLTVNLYENGKLSAQHIGRATDRIFVKSGNLYTEYRVGNQQFIIVAGDGIYRLIFGNTLARVNKSCESNA